MVHVELAEIQRDAWRQRIELEDYPRGVNFPPELIGRFLQRGLILDVGCGPGKNVVLESVFGIMGLDINEAAVVEAKSRGLPAFLGDATRVGFSDWRHSSLISIEQYDGILAEGLLCNLVGDQPGDFFDVVQIQLAPEGYLFVADFLKPTEETEFLREQLSLKQADEEIAAWKERYQNNIKALDLQHGTFVVAESGLNKALEWGGPEELRALARDPRSFERFARHYTLEEIRDLALATGLEEKHYEPTMFYSARTGKPLLGCLFVFQKSPEYQFHPWWKGKTRDQRAGDSVRRDRLGAFKLNEPGAFFKTWARQLRENIEKAGVDWETLFPQLQEFLK